MIWTVNSTKGLEWNFYAQGVMQMMEFKVAAMSCGHCVGVINKALMALDPAAKVEIDLAEKLVKVESLVAERLRSLCGRR